MTNETENKIQLEYLKDYDVFFIDYSGKLTFEKGFANMNFIKNTIHKLLINENKIKLIIDLRNTVWENSETHYSLSKLARKIFDYTIYGTTINVAILNREITGLTFENEHWFTQKDDAVKWLKQKR